MTLALGPSLHPGHQEHRRVDLRGNRKIKHADQVFFAMADLATEVFTLVYLSILPTVRLLRQVEGPLCRGLSFC